MKVISSVESQETLVELKYCERCGGLWLRPQGTDRVFCASCHAILEARPDPPVVTPRKGRHRKRDGQRSRTYGEDVQRVTRIDDLQGVATMELEA
jgi:Zn-finger nucleic acid-binding protein